MELSGAPMLPEDCTGPFGFAQGRLFAAKNAAQDDRGDLMELCLIAD